jgi:TetR/AcrR family transcriptional regulator, regulator of biofilm formation and stress response
VSRMNVDERRARLVDAAIQVMSREGVSHATTRAIVSEAGMTTGAFHYSFFSKEELVLEVMRILNARAFQAVREQVRADGTGPEVIDRVVGAYVDHVAGDAARRQLSFELTLHALREPGLREAAVELYRATLDGAEELLELMARSGGFDWRLPPAELSRRTLSLIDGCSYQWLLTQDEVSLRLLHDSLVELLQAQVVPTG